ncbi:MAG: MerR family transcriptional regulator [Pseudomonadota bacterium]
MSGKSPEAFRTISEVSTEIDVPAHVLRFWESRFTQVKPVKRGGGRRYYRPEDVMLLRGIRALLYTDGLTIKGVQKVLREQGVKRVAARGSDTGGEAPDGLWSEPAPEVIRRAPGSGRIEALKDVVSRLETLRDRIKES